MGLVGLFPVSPAAAPMEALPAPRREIELPCCPACGGDGALPIEPIREDGGFIWSIVPCAVCAGTGIACRPA